ncbi:MAG: hypothetical protein PHH75_05135 [Candidatus Omnitrophica bacterium]|nr:hypothetical protein [Candidatus Omnitrophota bacterium]
MMRFSVHLRQSLLFLAAFLAAARFFSPGCLRADSGTSCPLQDPWFVIVQFGLPFVFILVFLGVYYSRNSKRSRALKELTGRFGGKLLKFSLFATWEGVFAGRLFRLRLVPEGKNTPAYLELSVFKKSSYVLKVARETWAHRAGKFLGWLREVRTHDPVFDKEFFVSSNKPVRAAEFLNRPDVKPAILSLFADGFEMIRIDEKKIFIRKPRFSTEHDLAPEVVEQTLRRLETLAVQE